MGQRTIIKNITLATIGLRVASRMFREYKEAKAKGSPGGEKVTFDEWVDMSLILQEEIMSALPEIDAYVILMPKDMGYE